MLLDFIVFIIILSMAVSNKEEALACDTPLFTWLVVFSLISLAQALKHLVLILVIMIVAYPKKIEAKIDLIFCCSVVNF